MTKETVFAFLKAIGVSKVVVNGDWINCSCPLARWTHEHKRDDKPSFGVVVTTDGTAIYRCFSCTPDAERLEGLLVKIKKFTGKNPRAAASILANDKKTHENELGTMPDVILVDDDVKVKKKLKGT